MSVISQLTCRKAGQVFHYKAEKTADVSRGHWCFPCVFYGAQEPYLTLLNPLSPNIRIQILQTDLYIFP